MHFKSLGLMTQNNLNNETNTWHKKTVCAYSLSNEQQNWSERPWSNERTRMSKAHDTSWITQGSIRDTSCDQSNDSKQQLST